ncbi:MAG TPA: MarR family transcriptional regulator, partial [Thermodesulfobacteriota bacterium]|nr:MarR family transcriptional regulator [Thermodesulfobacteriota bacterium]
LADEEARLLEALADGPATVDALAERCRLPAGTVAAALLRLELAGLVDPPAGQVYSARPQASSRQHRRRAGCGSGSSTS